MPGDNLGWIDKPLVDVQIRKTKDFSPFTSHQSNYWTPCLDKIKFLFPSNKYQYKSRIKLILVGICSGQSKEIPKVSFQERNL